jgi:SPX domain protein involved in polyphosphate accumulation
LSEAKVKLKTLTNELNKNSKSSSKQMCRSDSKSLFTQKSFETTSSNSDTNLHKIHTIHNLPDRYQQRSKRNDMKAAFSEFYLFLFWLRNYQLLNFQGFRKILKKHDKLFKTSSGNEWRKVKVDLATFFVDKEVDNLITKVENIFTQHLEYGNRKQAINQLRTNQFQNKVRFVFCLLC